MILLLARQFVLPESVTRSDLLLWWEIVDDWMVILWCLFFFSSRRRHTRFKCDWSSDVCSSDLAPGFEMHYLSRTRGLWRKGATSGNVQKLVSLSLDCDGDTVLARVSPFGPACHLGDRKSVV